MRLAALTFTFVLALLFCAAPSHAQRIELYGSYSYVRAPVTFFEPILCPIPGCPAGFNTHTLNFNGYSVGGAFKLLGPLAIKADFSDTSNSFQGADTHLKTYLLGPQLRFPGPVSPFAHFLVGGAHESTNTGSGSLLFAPTQNAFATAIGGGIDLKLLPFIAIRPIQIDYLATRFNSKTQNQPRVSAGIVVRF